MYNFKTRYRTYHIGYFRPCMQDRDRIDTMKKESSSWNPVVLSRVLNLSSSSLGKQKRSYKSYGVFIFNIFINNKNRRMTQECKFLANNKFYSLIEVVHVLWILHSVTIILYSVAI